MTAERVFVFVDEEELFSVTKDLDCLYCRIPVTASKQHLRKKHLRFAIYYKDSGLGKFSIPCYCSDGGQGRSHWHCPMCSKILHRTQNYKIHITNHGVEMTDKSSVELQPTTVLLDSLQTDNEDKTPDNKAACQKCGILFTTTSNLRRHERLQHSQDQQPILCIDAKNAIYVTPKYLHGPRVPIHIRKSFTLQILLCELEECWDFMKAQAQSGNPGKECRHLLRTNQARLYVPPPPLCINSLEEMSHKHLLSASERHECQEINSRACMQGVDCVYPIFWGEHDLSERCVFFSVYTDLEDKWCQFGRTCVSFDTKSGSWKCLCKHKRSRCVHKCLSMWWLFQERPELLQNALDVHAESVDVLEEAAMDAEDVL
ncbi:uncharacterized protein LOC107675163 [Sinocyclocheilus anshuiensis]|uniref:uncharacterized protein LOC107675163 n=1 Tax=Sinocyclocheilus anshuiensis TaxID=1608454 RepID=UPI0007B7EA52|nr:PREDICTED: uncharacterized protein LOC107675163 [Sinocyclocheilus anshuiensis]